MENSNSSTNQRAQVLHHRPVVHEGAGAAMAPPDFGKQLTLSQTEGSDFVHQITTGTTKFSDLPTALYGKYFNCMT